ncbi:Uncharacterized conserved protein [Thermosyntropha lipolytica DSM 11003]|uniref:Stage 0 sporulation protein A homolog n=1 Tax=Thermosyntropha lipolytica DSM 11003 TaxID=1123382 RepID=A0A1M5P460_9FIRM|nr:Na-translocating system protein MpsC family protein [Thermosyntropha lipolytica]SHG96209.1 Uncharacterized conserved protein [Thermosyntropha lipolytica DSM 11003]
METYKDSLLSRCKVLYVEDEEFTREELGFFLKKRVGRLITAVNGEEGLKLAKLHEPDIALVDVRMPVMDGITMCRKMREAGMDCAFIIASALSDSPTILQAVDVGIVKYIVKPLNPNQLLEVLENTAQEIWRRRFKKQAEVKGWSLEREKRLELEKRIKSAVAYFLKSATGKGPRDIQVFLGGGSLEVKAIEVLTLLEQSILASGKNGQLVAYLRHLLYKERGSELEAILGEILSVKVKIRDIQVDVNDNRDGIIFDLS